MLMTGFLWQFYAGGEEEGLVYVREEIGITDIEERWMAYWADAEDPSLEDFCDIINKELGGEYLERVFVDHEIYSV